LSKSIHDDLEKILGPENVTDELDVLEEYSGKLGPSPQKRPVFVVWSTSGQDIIELVKWANENKVSLIPVSSSGPRIRGDSSPKVKDTVIVDLSKMKRIIRVDHKNKVVMLEPGVTFSELLEETEKHGLQPLMPFLPKKGKSVLAACLDREPIITPRFHWDISDPLLCTETIFGTGNLFRTGAAAGPGSLEEQWASGQAQKNPQGPAQFDPYRLVQGSQGTIGIVTWITMKCEKTPEKKEVYLVGAEKIDEFKEFSYSILRRRLLDEHFIVNSMALASALKITKSEIEKLHDKLPNWILIAGISGKGILAEDEFEYRRSDTIDIATEFGLTLDDTLHIKSSDIKDLLYKPSTEPYWKLRFKGGCREILFTTTLDRVSSFYDAFLDEAEKNEYSTDEIAAYIQPIVHGTSTHCCLDIYYNPHNEDDVKHVDKLLFDGSMRLLKEGAFFSRPFGPFTDVIFENSSSETLNALRKVKGIFDPNNILNPGTLCFKEVP
jgi:FAD/FMN-containing dehydrogenase